MANKMDPDEILHEAEGSRPRMAARVLTWNINGLRKVAADHGGLRALLDQFQADIVCFQEIKITRAGLVEHDLARAQGYHCFFSHCKIPRKSSYSGVATFVRSGSGLRTLASTSSLSDARLFGSFRNDEQAISADRLVDIDAEGRVLVTDHGHFVLFNIYGPCISSGDEEERTEKRRTFKRDFLAMLEARILAVQEGGRHVIVVGDLNACASQLDHGFTMTDKEFYSSEWSKWIRGLLGLDSSDPRRVLDCFRHRYPERKNAFTCWNTQTGARDNNYGTRIDYIIADVALVENALESCDILPEFSGSDHCPVRAKFLLPAASVEDENGRGSAASPNSIREDGVGGVGGADNPRDWPEHPPGCSCFYREVKGKQEKLAKFLVAGSDLEFAGSGTRGQERALDHSKSVRGRNSRNGLKRTRQSKLMFPTIPKAGPKVKAARGSGARGPREVMDVEKTTVLNLADESVQFSRQAEERGRQPSGSVFSRSGTIGGGSDDSRDGSGLLVGDAAGKGGEERGADGGDDRSGSAEAWKALFNRRKSTPLCEHGEPSIQRTVVKQGANHNRRFYTCARSAGNWPADRNARCSFFQWRLDGVRGYKDRSSQGENPRKLLRTATA